MAKAITLDQAEASTDGIVTFSHDPEPGAIVRVTVKNHKGQVALRSEGAPGVHHPLAEAAGKLTKRDGGKGKAELLVEGKAIASCTFDVVKA